MITPLNSRQWSGPGPVLQKPNFSKWKALGLVIFLIFSSGSILFAQPDGAIKNILVIHPYLDLGDWGMDFNKGMYNVLFSGSERNIVVYMDFFGSELVPAGAPADSAEIADLYRLRDLRDIDLVVSLFPDIQSFILESGRTIFPGTPVIFVPTAASQLDKINEYPNSYAIRGSFEYAIKQTLADIFTILPNIDLLLVCVGTGENDRPYLDVFKNAFKPYEKKASVEYYIGETSDVFFSRASSLPKNSAVFYLPESRDKYGNYYSISNYFPELPEIANAPVFSFFDTVFGTGIVGGELTSAEEYGRQTGESALDILSGNDNAVPENAETTRKMYDWRQLKRWNIEERLLPENAEIFYKTESFWLHYKRQIITILIVLALQLFLIISLAVTLAKRKKEQILLRRNEELLERSQETAKIGGWEVYPSSGAIFFTKEIYRIFELGPDYKPKYEDMIDYCSPDDWEFINKSMEEAKKTGKPFNFEVQFKTYKNNQIWVHAIGGAVLSSGKISYLSGTIQDISERKQAEIALYESDVRLQATVSSMPALLIAFNERGEIIFWNAECERISGYVKEEVLGGDKVLSLIFPGINDKNELLDKISTNSPNTELEITCRDGTKKTISWLNAAFYIEIPGWKSWALGIDVTKRKADETRIRESLLEKEILLKEVHHRVKNNMAIILSFLELQASTINEPPVIDALKTSQNRIRSMSLIHEQLYKDDSIKEVIVDDYIGELVRGILGSFRLNHQDFSVVMDIDQIQMDMDALIPIGLIINEIITNSIKYAFNNTQHPRIEISLKLKTDGGKSLRISDNGPGMPGAEELQKKETIGSLLIQTLTAQINGTMKIISGPGVAYEINF